MARDGSASAGTQRRRSRRPRALLSLLLALGLLAPALADEGEAVKPSVDEPPPTAADAPDTPTAPSGPADPQLTGLIRERGLAEISGIASSRRHPGVLWVHNDSGYAPAVHAIDQRGRRLATLEIEGVAGTDFEDMAAFERDGRQYLLVADTGDNGGLRSVLELVVIEEPAALVDARVKPAWVQRFRWPDGPRDVEAVAVDGAGGAVLFVSKKRVPPELLVLPLGPSASVQSARWLGTLAGIEQPRAPEIEGNPRFGRYRSQITGADLSPDGRALAVLNYRRAHLYRRRDGETWVQALARPPLALEFGWAAQVEAIAFDADGRSLWISGERLPAPLIRLPLAE